VNSAIGSTLNTRQPPPSVGSNLAHAFSSAL